MEMIKESLHYILFKWGVPSFFEYPFFVVIILAIFILIIAKIANHISIRYIEKYYKGANLKFIYRLKTILIYTLATYGILNMIKPFQSIISLLLASGGVLALAIGLATQEAASNFVNGIMIAAFKPFKIGDLIKVNNGEYIGYVVDITIRHTIIKTFENTNIIIPNSTMDKAILENISNTNEKKANFLFLQISYESDLSLAMKLIEEEVKKHPNFIDGRSQEEMDQNLPMVVTRLIEFQDSGILLRTTVYSNNNSEGFAMLSDLRIAIKKQFDTNHIEIPYPHCQIVKS